MKREIKFRQPITDSKGVFKEWFYWGFIDGDFITPALQTNGYDSRKESQQFTGLHDKNGTPVYEGDILRYWDGTDKAHYKIYWDESQSRFFDTRLEDGDSQTNYDGFEFVKDCKVIGNIHENPELL